MDQEGPRNKTLNQVRRELKLLQLRYPEDAPDELRAEYFAEAINRGLARHTGYGVPRQACLEIIGLVTGASGSQLENWISGRVQIHAQFHLNALGAVAALMDEHILACEKTLKHIELHLYADDWRCELGAFVYLKEIGISTLRKFGGAEADELARRLSKSAEDAQDTPTLASKSFMLKLIAEALKTAIGRPEKDADSTEGDDERDGQAPYSGWVN